MIASLCLALAAHAWAPENVVGAAGKGTRVNRVRYYRFEDFEEALLATEKGQGKRKEIGRLFR